MLVTPRDQKVRTCVRGFFFLVHSVLVVQGRVVQSWVKITQD